MDPDPDLGLESGVPGPGGPKTDGSGLGTWLFGCSVHKTVI